MSSKLIETSKHDIAGEFDIRFQYRVLGSRANKELAISFPCFFHVIIWYSMSIRVQSISSISLLKTHTYLFPIFSLSFPYLFSISVLCQCFVNVHFFVGNHIETYIRDIFKWGQLLVRTIRLISDSYAQNHVSATYQVCDYPPHIRIYPHNLYKTMYPQPIRSSISTTYPTCIRKPADWCMICGW
jgi:hypothetical protein